jgi:hypothetical protein
METIQKIIKQKNYDRYVFLSYENNVLRGLNFHQGLDDLDYAKLSDSCDKLTTIYNNLVIKKFEKNLSEKKLINLSIRKYTNKYILPKSKKVKIPNDQTRLIQKAIAYYVKGAEEFRKEPHQEECYDLFDLNQLREMLNYDIHISITDIEKDNFCFAHGMDFPEYTKK